MLTSSHLVGILKVYTQELRTHEKLTLMELKPSHKWTEFYLESEVLLLALDQEAVSQGWGVNNWTELGQHDPGLTACQN